tara:strand:+ start:104 stop:415 length:312 start_codon:yes stop_codon:yes gene_type:complete
VAEVLLQRVVLHLPIVLQVMRAIFQVFQLLHQQVGVEENQVGVMSVAQQQEMEDQVVEVMVIIILQHILVIHLLYHLLKETMEAQDFLELHFMLVEVVVEQLL